jgi:molybdopterin molybdotransferase
MTSSPFPTDPAPSGTPSDVRMRGFARRVTVKHAVEWIDRQVERLSPEQVPLDQAAGRVLASPVVSSVDVPPFERSMMDGYALRAEESLGASPYNRLELTILGESLPGRACPWQVTPGAAVRIMTGAPLPAGANAVLPVERVEVDGERLFVLDALAPGKHVGRRGEDIAAGAEVLGAGRRLRPQDLGVLSSIGAASVDVVRMPKVRIVTTGNELLPPGSKPEGHRIVDANTPMLVALIQRDGGVASTPGIIPDSPDAIRESLHDDADVVLVSGGSSVGQEDYAPRLLAEHGELAIHGVAMRPSSPAGMGRLGHRLVFLLPGNPVSCLCAYDFFAGRAIRQLTGRRPEWPYRSIRLPLARKLVSTVGRLDYARVQVVDGQVEPLAISGASVLSSTTRASGFVVIPEDSEGFPAGREVELYLYEL